ncbi:MAG: hypothetical protein ACLP0J_17210 [Solirubrobacteraceae bacterium]
MDVSVDELRAVIERHLDDLSDEAERLRSALEALSAPGDSSEAVSAMRQTPRSMAARQRATPPRGGTRAARDGERISAKPSVRAQQTSEQSPVQTRHGGDTVPATAVDRALQELRRELTAALRNGSR